MKPKITSSRPLKVVIEKEGAELNTAVFTGRVLRALEHLVQGPCITIFRPAPRWSDCVFRQRGEGVVIESEHEPHGGDYPGTYARYHLHSKITFVGSEGEVAA